MRAAALGSVMLLVGLSSVGHGQDSRERDELLKEKIATLDRLQAEVYELRRESGELQQIVIKVQVMELALTKMRKLGFAFQKFGEANPTAFGPSTTNEVYPLQLSKGLAGLLEALRRENLLKVLAEPTLLAVDGRPASITCGGKIPLPVTHADGSKEIQFREFGTHADLVATLLGSRQVRLEIRVRVSEVDPSFSVIVEGQTIPGIRTREVNTGFEAELGKTVVISGLLQQRTEKVVDPQTQRESTVSNQVQTLVLITPELVDLACP